MSVPRWEQARELHARGDFAGAIAAYEEVLRQEPDRAELWHMKGVAEHQAGKLREAQASAERAIALGGEQPAFLFLQGAVLQDQGRLEEAEGCMERAVATRPSWAAAQMELGRIRLDRGRLESALEAFRAAITLDPQSVRGWNNVGVTLQALERADEAMRAFDHALTLDPRYPRAHLNLARLHLARANGRRALEHARAAVQGDRSLDEAWLIIGDAERGARRYAEAFDAYAAAIQASPRNIAARNAHAELLAEVGQYVEGKAEFRRNAEHFPSNLKAALGANLVLPRVYGSGQELIDAREAYAQGLDQLHETSERFKYTSGKEALNDARWTNFYLAYQGRDDVALQKRYGDFLQRVLEPLMPQRFQPRPARARGARLRVGFFSHFFFNCTVGRYFASWITGLDRDRYESFVYYTNDWIADDTRAIAASAGTFRHLAGQGVEAMARVVEADDLDVLVFPELGMHPDTFTLAALRLARVQCAGWGHPDTTGLPGIDVYISCAQMEPADAATHYAERLELLPGLGTRYAMPRTESQDARAAFGLPDDRTLYLVPQSLFKIHPDNDALIAEILARDPRGMAVFFAANHDLVTDVFEARMAKAFDAQGLALAEKARFVMPTLPHGAYLRMNQLCDVMIDTLHWSGGNTSLDALASGLPVVTLPGRFMRGRQTLAMLHMLGLEALVAKDERDFVDIAHRLGTDASARGEARSRILAERGRLFDRDEPLRAFNDLLERVYASFQP